jgi:predicted nucleotidyltransferase
MNDRENEILENAVRIIRTILNPERIYLFGSRAEDNFSKGSDFDIAVDSEKPSDEVKHKINEELEENSGLYSIDVLYLPDIEDKFKEVILSTGKVIYEK